MHEAGKMPADAPTAKMASLPYDQEPTARRHAINSESFRESLSTERY